MVQGVFFRASLSSLANEERVCGWVRNMTDGSVEATLEGEEASVNKVVDWARHGPPRARVESVRVTKIRMKNLKSFSIEG